MTLAPTDRPRFRPLLSFLLASLVLAAATAIVFGTLLSSSTRVVSLPGTDIWRQFFAWRQFGFGQLADGHLALWNPYIFCGAPYLGGFQSALLYPPNWLYLILPLPVAINVGVAVNVFLSGVFMYAWAAYRRLHWLACVAAGLVFMFGGAQMGQVLAGHLSNLCALIWAPLIFLAVDDLVATGSLRAVLLGSAAVALQVLAGHPQYVFFTAVSAGIYLLLQLASNRCRLRALAGFFAFYCAGAMLSAAQLLTGLQATSEAMRTRLSYHLASTFSFPPENLVTLILPAFFGDTVHAPYWGRWFYWEMSGFIGVAALLMACFAIAVPARKRRFAFVMLAVTFLLALGRYTPLGAVVFRLPGFDSFRGISKFMFLVTMFLALLTGMGLDWLLRGGKIRRWVLDYIGGATVLFIVAAITISASARSGAGGWWGQMLNSDNWTYHTIHVDGEFIQKAAHAAVTNLWWAAGACIAVGASLLLGRRYPRAHWVIAAVLAVELVVFAKGIHSSFAVADLQKQADALSAHFPDTSDSRIFTYQQGEFLLKRRLNSWGDDPMMLRRYMELIGGATGMKPDQLIDHMPDAREMLARIHAPAWKLTRTAWFFASLQGPNSDILLRRAQLIGHVEVEPDHAALVRKNQ